MTYVVALTGRMGSGKSQALSRFESLGAAVFSADACVHRLLEADSDVYAEIVNKYPQLAQNNGSIDRPALGALVFSNQDALDWLESLIHPRVRDLITKWSASIKEPYGVVEIPLFTEENRLPIVQRVCVVDASDDCCLQRILKRDKRNLALIERMRARQLSRDDLLSVADDVVFNESSVEQLSSQIETLHGLYLTLAERSS